MKLIITNKKILHNLKLINLDRQSKMIWIKIKLKIVYRIIRKTLEIHLKSIKIYYRRNKLILVNNFRKINGNKL